MGVLTKCTPYPKGVEGDNEMTDRQNFLNSMASHLAKLTEKRRHALYQTGDKSTEMIREMHTATAGNESARRYARTASALAWRRSIMKAFEMADEIAKRAKNDGAAAADGRTDGEPAASETMTEHDLPREDNNMSMSANPTPVEALLYEIDLPPELDNMCETTGLSWRTESWLDEHGSQVIDAIVASGNDRKAGLVECWVTDTAALAIMASIRAFRIYATAIGMMVDDESIITSLMNDAVLAATAIHQLWQAEAVRMRRIDDEHGKSGDDTSF